MTPLSFSFLVLAVLVAAVVLVGLQRLRRGAAVVPAIAMAGWFGVVLALAKSGVLGQFERLPPRAPMMVLGAVGLALLVARTKAVREALERMPAWWPVALQGVRLPIELALYGLWLEGVVPTQMTFHGQNFDVLVGIGAPLMAWLIAQGRASRGMQVAWQLVSVALLVNVLRIAITSAPGPLHLDWPGEPLTFIAQWPHALLPGFLVPTAVLGHVAAIGALRREGLALSLTLSPSGRGEQMTG